MTLRTPGANAARFAGLAAAAILHAVPALAAVDPPAASGDDTRIRTIPYVRNNPVQIFAVPGASFSIELGAGETVEQVIVSDQGTLGFEADEPVALGTSGATNVSTGLAGGAALEPSKKWPPSCDANLCRVVDANFIYLRPLRQLEPQPLFVQTKYCAPDTGKCEMIPYRFELATRPSDVKASAANVAWSVTFTYPDRERAARQAEQRKAYAARVAAWRERQALRTAPPAAPGLAANWQYGFRGSEAVRPDEAWDDGRTTFLRFNGNRRVPNVYRRLPDGHEGIPAYATEPDAGGVVLRIARTDTKWFLRDGDEAGCLFNVGPDPDGRAAATVASTVSPGTQP